jgi:hypothetical protein
MSALMKLKGGLTSRNGFKLKFPAFIKWYIVLFTGVQVFIEGVFVPPLKLGP